VAQSGREAGVSGLVPGSPDGNHTMPQDKPRENEPPSRHDEVVRLEDLAPRRDPSGGAAGMVFGEDPPASPTPRPVPRR
jgi:hypothetical protein